MEIEISWYIFRHITLLDYTTINLKTNATFMPLTSTHRFTSVRKYLINITSYVRHHSRKRGRTPEDETEFMPLSKRINNLHLNNCMLFSNSTLHHHSTALHPQEWEQCNYAGIPVPNIPTPPESQQNLSWNTPSQSQYNPELSESENPYYFNINKLLFEMYLERQQRTGNTMWSVV